MTRVLLIFLDGIGLGDDDPAINPFAAARTPTLEALAGGRRWLRDTPRYDTSWRTLAPKKAHRGWLKPQSSSLIACP